MTPHDPGRIAETRGGWRTIHHSSSTFIVTSSLKNKKRKIILAKAVCN